MICKKHAVLLALPLALIAASDQPWKDKEMTQWNVDDAKLLMTDSPWAKQVTPLMNSGSESQRGSRGGGRRGNIGMGIPGIGGVGMPGGGSRRGGGYPGGGGGYPGGGGGNPQDSGRYPQDDTRYPQDGNDRYPQDGSGRRGGDQGNDSREPPTLTVRWESALPIQQAVLKSKDANAPSIDETHYAIAVFGLPARLARNPQMTESKLKGQAELKRNGKRLSKPSDVRVISRDDGMIVVYLFPRNKEIRKTDHDIEFTAHIGRFELKPLFDATEMVFKGKLEL